MSYSRFGYADVYVYMDVNGSLACCGCFLGADWYFDSTEAMVDHLAEHRAAGHEVPPGIEDSLREDDADNFPASCVDGHVWGEPFHPYPDSQHLSRLQRVNCTDCSWLSTWPPDLPTRKASA
jgi:hypothetical protein